MKNREVDVHAEGQDTAQGAAPQQAGLEWVAGLQRLMRPQEVARVLQIPVKRVYALDLPRIAVLPERGTRFDPKDVVEWLRGRRMSGSTGKAA